MPLYDYRCRSCGEQFEVLVGTSSSGGAIECPTCGVSKVEKLMNASWTPSRLTQRRPGKTCCGADERCEKPPCSDDGTCHK